jgi:uncharacterized protein (TIGR02246 family)
MVRRIECPWVRPLLCGLFSCLLGVTLFLFMGSPAAAQKNKGKDKNTPPAPDSGESLVPLPDNRAVDLVISEMLGAWQIGDIDRLHKAYADDVIVVSGTWDPPVIGWENFLRAYQQQRARMQEVRLDRQNTYIKVDGNVAWANYQWDFSATVDGEPAAARGHTSLVLEKRDGRWVIVHNHTSLVSQSPATTPPVNSAPAESKTPVS